MQVLERYKSQNLQRVCNFEVNKAQIKNGIRFWCSVYFILLKTSSHQNKTNRVCIKHWNLQCFLSMSFNVFNATLGSDTFPPSRGRPWGYHIYIYIIYIYYFELYTFKKGWRLWPSARASFAGRGQATQKNAFNGNITVTSEAYNEGNQNQPYLIQLGEGLPTNVFFLAPPFSRFCCPVFFPTVSCTVGSHSLDPATNRKNIAFTSFSSGFWR